MQQAGTKSWRFAHDIGQMPNAVIYVRDALRLPVEEGKGMPPRLIDEVPDRAGLLQGSVRADAASQWNEWWIAVGKFEAQTQLGDASEETRTGHLRILDPQTAPMLSGAFRSAAATLFREGCHWVDGEDGRRRRTLRGGLGGFEWHLIRDVVEEVAAAAGVSTGAIGGAVSALLVEGVWGDVAATQFAWCSLAAARDPLVSAEILRALFMSGL
jgi:hypothetical protein